MGTSFSASLLKNRGLCPIGVGVGSRWEGAGKQDRSSELPVLAPSVTAAKALGSSSG